MSWFVTPDGAANWAESVADLDAATAQGFPIFASLTGAIMNAGVQASSFSDPFRIEPVYTLASYPVPVGQVGIYRVEFTSTPTRSLSNDPSFPARNEQPAAP